MLEIIEGALSVGDFYKKYHKIAMENNCGACCIFCGVVREEKGNDGLSFDIYEPLLKKWFEEWRVKLKNDGALLCMAHSRGDVFNQESSFICAIISSQRKVALQYYAEFVEDFKHNAPIWKYDLREGKRIYAKDRSYQLPQSGIFA